LNKHLMIPDGNISEFNKFVNYCFLLSRSFTDQDEAARYQGRYGLSIYFSVLLYWLLTSYGVINEKKLNFCQGYYSFAVPEDSSGNVRYRAGIHSWLSMKGSVLDVTLWQYDFPEFKQQDRLPRVITGRIPDNINLIGFEEDKSLAKEYARQFAKDSGLTFYNWLNHHRKQAGLFSKVRRLERETDTDTDKHQDQPSAMIKLEDERTGLSL